MIRYSRPARLLAVCLSALAGFVDAAGFLHLGGYFVSFMSGNSTRLAVAAADGGPITAAVLIVSFVVGVTVSSLIARRVSGASRASTVLALVAALLACAALGSAGRVWPSGVLMALAMGAENAVFSTDSDVHIGLTYMTGALVKLGQRLAIVLSGGSARDLGWYLALWLGLVAGAVFGAFGYRALGPRAFGLAAACAAGLAVVARGMRGVQPVEG